MNARKALVGLSLLCVLVFCAFGAASASAKGTTVGECSSTAEVKDFEDAHCDKAAGAKNFGHVLFPNGIVTPVTAANDLTGTTSTFTFSTKIAATFTHITCESVTGKGAVTNEEAGGVMKVKFGTATAEFTKCKVTTPAAATKCVVRSPIIVNSFPTDPMNLKRGAKVKDVTNETEVEPDEAVAGGTEMGLRFIPDNAAEPNVFAIIFLEGAECPAALKGAFKVEGNATCTPGRANGSLEATAGSGATCVFSKGSTIGHPAAAPTEGLVAAG